MTKSRKTIFVCQECGAQSPKWLGRCTECGAWNSLVEEHAAAEGVQTALSHRYEGAGASSGAQLYADVELAQHARLTTSIDEFDRVLGGGVVPGSLILLGGEPGIGKSTLLLQAAPNMARTIGPVLYSSGEESEHQIKSRGERLAVGSAPLYLLAETCLERVLEEVAGIQAAPPRRLSAAALSAGGALPRADPRGDRAHQAGARHRRPGADGADRRPDARD